MCGDEEETEVRGEVAPLGGRRLPALVLWGPASNSAPLSPTMVGCRRPSSLLAIASFLLPLINISHASLMTRIGLRLGGKHSSVSHQVLQRNPKREKDAQKNFFKVGTHRSRVPWAVKIQREEEQEEWGKKVGVR